MIEKGLGFCRLDGADIHRGLPLPQLFPPGSASPATTHLATTLINVEKIKIPGTDFAWQAEKAPVSSDILLVQCGLLQGLRALPQSKSGRLTPASKFPM